MSEEAKMREALEVAYAYLASNYWRGQRPSLKDAIEVVKAALSAAPSESQGQPSEGRLREAIERATKSTLCINGQRYEVPIQAWEEIVRLAREARLSAVPSETQERCEVCGESRIHRSNCLNANTPLAAPAGAAPAEPRAYIDHPRIKNLTIEEIRWQAQIAHTELDKLKVPQHDGEDNYSLWGRIADLYTSLCGERDRFKLLAAPSAGEQAARHLLNDCLKGLRVLRAIGKSRSYKTVGKVVDMPDWGKPSRGDV